ncbi:MAG TPA: MASE3 domain-containing protein [Vicinamibacterales bacterium]|nr:MASE3 domain-containing protein [Vicinamibacterales bacterium]
MASRDDPGTGSGPEPALPRGAKLLQYLALGSGVAAVLWWVGAHNYLLYHALVELGSFAVAAAMFAVAWNSRRFSSNGYLTFLGITFLPIAVLDVLHTLSYQGMGVFAIEGADQATQFWIAGRALEAAALALSPLFLGRRVHAWTTLLTSAAIGVALLVSIVPFDLFPTCYVDSGSRQGLTPFKVAAEYVISLVLLGAGAWLRVRRDRLSRATYLLMIAAIATKILSELAFTQYVSVYGDFNKLGHLLKLASSALMFKAIVEGSLRHPYQVLFGDLQQREQTVRASEQRYRALVEVSPDGLLVHRNGRVELANPAAVQLFGGTSADQIVGRSPFDLFHPEYHEKLRQRIALLLQGRAVPLIEARLVRLDGRLRDVEAVAAPFDDVEGRAIQVVLRDITDRKRQREELHENALRLEEASRIKDEFLATLSHELRTPLNAILGWSEMLLEGGLQAGQTQRALEVIARNARAQTALISDVLDVSRIISGKLRLQPQPTDLVDAVRAALDTVRPAAEAREIGIVETVMERTQVQGDPDRLQQVFWNLLSNAVKFTPRGGRVDVAVRRGDEQVEVEVRDTGEGLEPEALPHLFERFWQADRSAARRHGGLGLGLAIVRHLVEAHGGQVRAESEGRGRGTRVSVTLPLRGAQPRLDGVTGTGRERRAGEVAAAGLGALAGLKALVVDDDPDAREMAGAALERVGAEVRLAAGASEGLRAVAEWGPDVVVADIGMPGEDGYHFIRLLRELPPERGGATPALALTAYGRAEDRRKALDAGYGEHVIKPVPPQVLAAAVAHLVSRPWPPAG